MQKRFIPITTVTVVLGVIAVIGYLRPAVSEEMPNRILFDNAGGHVIFSHNQHNVDYKIPCEKCHHESQDPSSEPKQCGTCHAKNFDKKFVEEHVTAFSDQKSCAQCHHAEFNKLIFNHEEHKEYGDCTDCHHQPDVEKEPQKCANCHKTEAQEGLPSLKAASHESCATCHDDMFDEGLEGCAWCHKMEAHTGKADQPYTPCISCHEEQDKELIPTRMNAFHVGCMNNCHAVLDKGPYKDNECNKCHIR